MKKDEIIAFLQQQNVSLQEQLKNLTEEVSSLRNLLEQKTEEENKQKRIIKGLKKISQNKSEKQTPVSSSTEETPEQSCLKKERASTNNGAKRSRHPEVEVVEVDVEPDDPSFDAGAARLYRTRDVIRYELIPMRFIKKVYHVKTYTQNDEFFSGKAPDAPFLNSQYDGSFIAGMGQLRYMYGMPMERIVKYFVDNGFEMDKATAHGLLRKTETLFTNLYDILGNVVKEDTYLAGDETYHRVLVDEKNKNGKGIRKGYVWVITGINKKLVYYFYNNGSRKQDVILDYMKGYYGTFQSDGFYPYRKMAKWLTRLACFQHVKRKFLDCGDDFDAQVIVRLINYLYHREHKHKIGKDDWSERDNYKWRQQYALPIMKIIRKKLDRIQADRVLLPKTEIYDAVNYMLNEWNGLMNIFKRGDFHLDNNLIERLNRYISISRRSSLFFGSHAGAKRSAMFYSLACSCRLQGVNFFEYISDVINKAAALPPNTAKEKYRNLLPDRWKEQNIAKN
jgi:transposase